jgi:hypothetical protein
LIIFWIYFDFVFILLFLDSSIILFKYFFPFDGK